MAKDEVIRAVADVEYTGPTGWVLLVILGILIFVSAVGLAVSFNVSVRPVVAWYDLWIGIFIDHKRQQLYFFPIPIFGFLIRWGDRD